MSRRAFKHFFQSKDRRRFEIRIMQIIMAVVIGLLLAGVIALWQSNKDQSRMVEMQDQAIQQATSPQSVPPGNSKLGGPFTLTDQNGKTVTDADYRGKYLLIYFGYTYCPDMCPTGLQAIAHTLDQLGPDAAKVQPLFVTIDPARDTADKLKDYDASFHPRIIGLTGTADQIAAIAKEYQVYYAKGEQVDENDYMMDHSSLIYLMDPQGHFITTFNEDANPDVIL